MQRYLSTTFALKLSLLGLLVLHSTTGRSQPATSQEFPIGGLTFGTTDDPSILPDSMKELGINSIFYRSRRGCASMPEGSRPFYNARWVFDNNLIGGNMNYPTFDWRYFLVSASRPPLSGEMGFQYELALTWPLLTEQRGEFRNSGREFFIPASQYITEGTTKFALRHLHNSTKGGDLLESQGQGLASREFFVDFIYRLRPSDYADLDPNLELFKLKVILKRYDNVTKSYNEEALAIHITYGDYLAYLQPDAPNRDPKYPPHAGEDPDLKDWPAPDYAMIRIPFELGNDYYPDGYSERKGYDPNNDPNDDDKDHLSTTKPMVNGRCIFSGMDIQLLAEEAGAGGQALNNNGIYVLGARVRSKQADDLLRGRLDSRLIERFNQLKTDMATQDPNYAKGAYVNVPPVWNKVKTIALGNELLGPGFRALAYIDKKWMDWSGGKRMGLILAHPYWGAYNFMQSIYFSEVGFLPEALNAETAASND